MKVVAAVLLILLGALGGWYVQHRALEDSRAKIAGIEAQRDAAVATAVEADAYSVILEDSLAAALTSAALADSLAAERIRDAHAASEAAEDSIRALLAGHPEAERQLDELLAAHRVEVAALLSQLDAKLLVIERQERLIASQRVSVTSWRGAYEAEAAIARHWKAEYQATQVFWRQPLFVAPAAAVLTAGITLAIVK